MFGRDQHLRRGRAAADLGRAIGTILGFAYVFNHLGGAVGTFAGGASPEWTGGFDAALWLSIITTAMALPGIWWLAREPQPVLASP